MPEYALGGHFFILNMEVRYIEILCETNHNKFIVILESFIINFVRKSHFPARLFLIAS